MNARELPRDTRGGVLVVGIALGALLTAALLYLVEVGGSTLASEAARNAADAAAFENAVWHARGMNTLSALNVSMAVVLSALVLWRLAISILTLATLLSLVTGTPPQPGPLLEKLAADRRVAEKVLASLSSLKAAELAVAAYTPVLARHAADASADRAGLVVSSFSASLFPTIDERAVRGLGDCRRAAPSRETQAADQRAREAFAVARSGAVVPSRTPLLGMPFSLPVESDDYSLLCGRAPDPRRGLERLGVADAEPSSGRALSALGLPTHGKRLSAVISSVLTGRASAVFCTPFSEARDDLERLGRDLASVAGEASLDPLRTGRALQSAWTAPVVDLECGRPARVWARAANGSVQMRSAALVAPDSSESLEVRAGVFSTREQLPDERVVIAHAEMYFDCVEEWVKCAPNAAWELGWTARLRRVRSFSEADRDPRVAAAFARPSGVDGWVRQIEQTLGVPAGSARAPNLAMDTFADAPRIGETALGRRSQNPEHSLDRFLEQHATFSSVNR